MTRDPAAMLEPVLDWGDIQGNILGGFNKDHQALLGLSFGSDEERNRRFVAHLSGMATSLEAVVRYKRKRRSRRANGLEADFAVPVWTAVAFSFPGLVALSDEADRFTDHEFRSGLHASSPRLGDPREPASPGHPSNWIVGSADHVPDVFVVMASDDLADLERELDALCGVALAGALEVIYREVGHNLGTFSAQGLDFPAGHEHFGFKDGISQPGVRGRLPDGTFLTARPKAVDPDPHTIEYAQPGQPLICPGQFVLGRPQQIDTVPGKAGPSRPLGDEAGAVAPHWAANGSFLVFRRLRQDVEAFRSFVTAAAAQVGDADLSSARLAAMLVGRWPSGAPLVRAPEADDPDQAHPRVANAFAYGSDNAGLGLVDDSDGMRCPVAAHVRKVNPRDGDTDIGAACATLTRRILRRGIPYGPPQGPEPDSVDRGLFFLSYQAWIAAQFEFQTTNWMNNCIRPRNPSEHSQGLGFDMIVGQHGADRVRTAFVRSPGRDREVSNRDAPVKDWVVPTGGGYFFAPSLTTLRRFGGVQKTRAGVRAQAPADQGA